MMQVTEWYEIKWVSYHSLTLENRTDPGKNSIRTAIGYAAIRYLSLEHNSSQDRIDPSLKRLFYPLRHAL
jgi:hypothetical protein